MQEQVQLEETAVNQALPRPSDEQQEAFQRAILQGHLMDFVSHKGGTGQKRKPLSDKAHAKRKSRNTQSKKSRKANR